MFQFGMKVYCTKLNSQTLWTSYLITLKNRYFTTKVNDFSSEFKYIKSEVPQNTVLAPIMYLI